MIKNFPLSSQQLAAPVVSQDVEPEYDYVSESEQVHLRDYWKILVKRRRMIALIFSAADHVGIGIELARQILQRYQGDIFFRKDSAREGHVIIQMKGLSD